MKARHGALFTCLATAMCALQARADEATDIQSLLDEHVIVTAASTAQRESAAPALSTTITAEDIKTFGFRSIAQAIDFLSLGAFTGDPLRTPDIGSRGVLFENDNGKHFLLLINGHAVNDPLYGAARFDMGAGIPIELVDHIEVVLGPGSVLYGSNAMLGVINVITKSAADYSGVHVYGDTEIGRSFRVGVGTGYAFKFLGLPSELTLGMEYSDRYGPKLDFPVQSFPPAPIQRGVTLPTAWGGRLDRGYFAQAPAGQLRLRVGELEVNLSANTYKRGIPYASALYYVDFNDGRSSELDRALRLDIRHQATISSLVQLTSRAYADSYDYQRRLSANASIACQSVSFAVCQHYDAGAARWIGLEERLTLNWLHDQTFVTALGIDVRERQVGAKQERLDADTGRLVAATSGRLDDHGASVGPYIQQTWNPAASLDLNAGARVDIDDRFSPVLSPRGAVVLRPFEKTTFKAIYAQAFRAPTWSETSLSNHTVAPAPGLLPERVRSIEASAEQGLGTQRLRLGAFATRWTDLVETAPVSLDALARLQESGMVGVVGNIVQSINVASINNYGVNGSWQGSSLEGKLRYGANVTWAFARVRKAGASTPLAAVPAIVGNAHVAYSFGFYLPTASFAVQAMGTRPADRVAPSNGATLPTAPPMADLRFALTGRIPKVPALGYVLTADYLTASRGPYTAGPDVVAIPAVLGVRSMLPAPGYAPIDELRIMVGLRLDFLTGPTPDTVEAP
jgi:outer membrane receptor for ferrienterochelin and colicins